MVYASSTGCLPLALWSIKNKHRVSRMFMYGTAGFQRGEYPDPYKVRTTEVEDVLPTKEYVDKMIWRRENIVHDFKDFASLPRA